MGRARGGLRARVNRHFKTDKKTFWHIDYLLKKAKIVEVLIKPRAYNECLLVDRLRRLLKNTSVPLPGFGSSDCRCQSHLVHLNREQDLINIVSTLKSELRMKSFSSTG